MGGSVRLWAALWVFPRARITNGQLERGEEILTKINELELQNIRHLANDALATSRKLSFFAQQCQDPTLKNMLQTGARESQQTADKLMKFLS